MKRSPAPYKNLGEAEQALMDYVWNHGPVTADACRAAWGGKPIKDPTVRTMLRRLEAKGYIGHTVEGRTFIYTALQKRESVAGRAVKSLIDRFCGGSAEELVLGMLRQRVLDRKQFDRIARQLEAEEKDAK